MAARHNKRQSKEQRALIAVYADTKRYFEGNDDIPEGQVIDIEYEILSKEHTIPTTLTTIPILEIINEDTLDMAHRYYSAQTSSKILVLNMASKYKPGGGVRNGRTAQEECLFRRTNAFLTHHLSHYPMDDNKIIFSPDITVIKDSHYNKIKPFHIGMISIPALSSPPVILDKYQYPAHRALMRLKIESIFEVAIVNEFDTLVLGALGCGVYKNPPEEVFKIFQNAINKYGHHFSRIGFAVLTFGANGKINFNIFSKMVYGR